MFDVSILIKINAKNKAFKFILRSPLFNLINCGHFKEIMLHDDHDADTIYRAEFDGLILVC